jgi:hypothetical protein
LPNEALLDDWELAEGPVAFGPDDLWEYLNGGAPLYVSYGFRRMAHTRYQRQGDPSSSVTIDVFDMGTDLGAFGLYTSIRPPGAEPVDWGAEGFRSGTVGAAWKGRFVVHGGADDEETELTAMLDRLISGIIGTAPGSTDEPEIIAALPADGLVAGSRRYLAEDLLGHQFLPGGVLATYRLGDLEGQLFFSDLGSSAAAAEALSKLEAHQTRWGGIAEPKPVLGSRAFDFSDPGLGDGTACAAGYFVVGVVGRLEAGQRHLLISGLIQNLGAGT